MGNAAMAPLGDLNIVRTAIPAVLVDAQRHPYQAPLDRSCAALAADIAKLDAVLGADFDAPAKTPAQPPSLLDRGSEVAEDQAVGAVQRTAEGLVPFRSWVRKLSGAERHARRMAAATSAGTARRAFLKGIAASEQCPQRPAMQATALAAEQ